MPDHPPPERTETVREALRRVLASGDPHTLLELSSLVGVSERDLPPHLVSLQRSVRREGGRLDVVPPVCLACDFEFTRRGRFTHPGRCPRCRATRIRPPEVQLELP